MDDEEIKLEIFADDLTVFLGINLTSLNALFDTIERFTLWSGLRINYEKMEAMFSGNQKITGKTEQNFQYMSNIVYNVIFFVFMYLSCL